MYNELNAILPQSIMKFNEPMKEHTTFKIGGPVDVMVMPKSIEELQTIITTCASKHFPYIVFGLGSNILVRDKGYRGIAIKLGNSLKTIQITDNQIYCEAGIRLSELSRKSADSGLSGLEFAEGIPGSLGGAIVMNAGAYDGEMKNVITSVQAISPQGEIRTFNSSELEFSYRHSIFQANGFIVVSALMKLKYDSINAIKNKMREFARQRREKQPLEFPSAGSIFRRPEGFYVGPMIEKMGLKGYRIGGAEVSAKHAGFIINIGDAAASDVIQLIKYIQEKALNQYGVNLQPEIVIIGDE
ncbi:MAG TPA: UDP-N-acetylmuramate dehydrogenase [Syntrophomonadaceae bacterium]|nr:UDP-N-acetylmuramate dehydrogenase [Syntrophomonadaceae bacterium]